MRRAVRAFALLAALALGSCGEEPPEVPPRPTATPTIASSVQAGGRTLTDMAGRTVSVPETVRGVAAMSPAAAEFAALLKLDVIGRTTDTPASVAPAAKPIGSAISPDFNAIAALAPDLVLADAAYHSGRARDFDQFAYPVFELKANSYPEVLAAITALGEATSLGEEAAAARQALETRAEAAIAVAVGRAALGTAPSVLILTGGGRDAFAGSSTTYLGTLVELVKGVNVLGAAPEGGPIAGFGVVEIGQAATRNPDVVLILSSGQGGLADQLKAHPAWANSSAVRQNRVHELDTNLFLRVPGPRVGEALETLLKVLWP